MVEVLELPSLEALKMHVHVALGDVLMVNFNGSAVVMVGFNDPRGLCQPQ